MKTICENVLHKELNYQVKHALLASFRELASRLAKQESTNQAVQHAPTNQR